MRIISGYFKGKKILEPKDKTTRPLKDLVKESIFNILKHSNKFYININNSNVLDLFSGTGAFGIECLSRGAKHVTFVENYSQVLPILKKNILNLKTKKNFKIIEQDISDDLIFKDLPTGHNIIFLDPPYKNKNLFKILENINNRKVLDRNGIIIIHRHKKDRENFPKNFKILEEKFYGISKIIFGILN